MSDVTLIILASGFSRRFASNKLLYKFKGKRLIEYALDKGNLFSQVLVVTQYEEVAQLAKKYGYDVVWNIHPEYGQGHSIALGVSYCQTDSCVLMVADMPYLKKETLEKMIVLSNENEIVICEHDGILCNPMLLPRKYYERAKQLKNDRGAKQILGKDTFLTVCLSDEEFIDIDTKTEAKN